MEPRKKKRNLPLAIVKIVIVLMVTVVIVAIVNNMVTSGHKKSAETTTSSGTTLIVGRVIATSSINGLYTVRVETGSEESGWVYTTFNNCVDTQLLKSWEDVDKFQDKLAAGRGKTYRLRIHGENILTMKEVPSQPGPGENKDYYNSEPSPAIIHPEHHRK